MRNSNHRRSVVAAAVALAGVLVLGCDIGAATPSPSTTSAPTPLITPDPHLALPASVDHVFRLLGTAGLRITPNTAAGGPDEEPRKRIFATYENWPLVLTEFSTPAALAKVGRFDPKRPPSGGEPPYILVGMNIMVEFGPEVRRAPDAASDPDKRDAFLKLVAALDPLLGPLDQRAVLPVPLPGGTPAVASPVASGTPGASGAAASSAP